MNRIMKDFRQPFLVDWSFAIVGGGSPQVAQLMRMGGATEVRGIRDADIVIFTGGADVHPSFYKEKELSVTYSDIARDHFEKKVFDTTGKKLRVGICRGGQFLNVMNKGKLWQDVDNHGTRSGHDLLYRMKNGNVRRVSVTSTHHQMMRPAEGGHVWGTANEATMKLSSTHTAPLEEGHNSDIEIVWYPKTRSLCFQPHPEYCMYQQTDCADLFFECLQRAITYKP